VDNGSSCNDCSIILVEKLTFITKFHPKPYKLVWIKDGGIIVKRQVSVPIFIDNYNENVLCDIAHMEIRHIILGRP